MNMTKENARDILARTCDQFYKTTGEILGLAFTWNGSLSVYGPEDFKKLATEQSEAIWLSLSNLQQKTSKPMVDDHMINGDLHQYCRATLRKLVSWATQTSINCHRNFWGKESLKPVWWPEAVKFQCISKSKVTKEEIINILSSYLQHNTTPVTSTSIHNNISSKEDKLMNHDTITSTRKRDRTDSQSSALITNKRQRITDDSLDDIISLSDTNTNSSFFENFTENLKTPTINPTHNVDTTLHTNADTINQPDTLLNFKSNYRKSKTSLLKRSDRAECISISSKKLFLFTYISSLIEGATIEKCEQSIHPSTRGKPPFSKNDCALGLVSAG